jgi:DNA-binding response OmpR family regulator
MLILEDEPVARNVLKKRLELQGYLVDDFDDPEEAIQACDKTKYDLLIFDITIHGAIIDGLEAASIIRKKHNVPFVLVTGADSSDARLRGLQEGALLYFTKPFSYKELVLNIKNIMENAVVKNNSFYIHRGLKVEPLRGTITKEDGSVETLSKIPMQVYTYLLEHKNQVVSKQELWEKIWTEHGEMSDDIINTTINRIRRKIGKNSINTIKNVGYEIND